tara:strand:+ start:2413 stop:5403 length:2991 start_codon:yes stop_codon:yes gene_type:complete
MSVKNYRFVSPGVFINEIDNSQLPASPAGIGPVIIGRAAKGPALRPTTVSSFSEFVQIFGNPSPGQTGNDVWRDGASLQAPTYGAYAAQAYLRNSSPLTFIRLLGAETTEGSTSGEGLAGWTQTKAYGLFVFESGSGATVASGSVTGSLGAIFYVNDEASIGLTGSHIPELSASGLAPLILTSSLDSQVMPSGGYQNTLIMNQATNQYQYKLIISDPSDPGATSVTSSFNFDRNSSKYIRKVFNTNPELLNGAITAPANQRNYFLGETFDRFMKENCNPASGITFAAVAELYATGSTASGSNFNADLQNAQTGWLVGCDIGDQRQPRLIKFHALGEAGDWSSRNLKISIQDIRQSTNESSDYGTFTVLVRRLSDSDNVVQVVEQFTECDLNPESLNYVARKVGDKYMSWREDDRIYQEVGDYDNRSQFIRVEINPDIEGGLLNAMYLPFGYEGIVKYKDETGSSLIIASTEGPTNEAGDVLPAAGPIVGPGNWVTGSSQASLYPSGATPDGSDAGPAFVSATTGSAFIISGSVISASVYYPAPEIRTNSSEGGLSTFTDAYFGLQTTRTVGGTVFAQSNIDTLRPRGGIVSNMFAASTSGSQTEMSVLVTLDDLSGSGIGGIATWVSGCGPVAGGTTSYTAVSGAISGVLDAGYDRFTVPLYGGFDGLNIDEMDPFRNSIMSGISGINDRNSYQFNSIRRAADSVADPEITQMNLLSAPGVTNEALTTNLIRICEDRADALAVIDLPDGFQPRQESTSSARNNSASTITQAIANLRARGLNTSYGCTFYPWVRARDTIGGQLLWLPPSVAAIGTFSSSQRKTQVWFAPAGFNRGGLTEGSAGIPVVDVAHQLRRKDRDDLYAASINPIAKFPSEGIVIFGQKTLQVTPSALDRINVRRLMIFVKKRISQMASTILFDPNVKTTWARFTSRVDPFLADVKTNFGLTDYKVVLDQTTTTPDLVDRNILYAKIFLKPTRAIEYIAIDFNITRTGASFDD